MSRLTGKIIIFCGATGKVGEPIAECLHAEGATLVLVARNEDNLLASQRKLGGDRVLVMPTDLSDERGVANLFRRVMETFGRIDAVIISVGEWNRLDVKKPFAEAVAIIKKDIAQLLLPSTVTGSAAQEFFRKQGSGLILFMGSHAAVNFKLPGNLSYAMVKAGERGFALSLREELAGSGVRVSVLLPAIINTRALENLEPEMRALAVQPKEIAESIIKNIDNPNIEAETSFPGGGLVLP
jgi:NAD(P)-dependent dehydrogenase (short-subunit alcohol dehydrogenase family)